MFTFTAEQLCQLLSDAITDFAGKGAMDYIEQYRQDRAATVERIMAQLEASQPQRDTLLENSIPAIDEDEAEFDYDAYFANLEAKEAIADIPYSGQPIPHETDDNISPAELGLPPTA